MTRTRRVNGEGTYYVDSKKGLASWRRNYIDRFGCKKRKSIYAKSKLELKPLIKKWEEELARNILPEDENLTVKDWLDIWLERFIKPNTKIRTYDNYNSCIDQYLKPQFGKEKLKKLTPLKIQAGLNDLLKYESKHKNMLSLKTVMNARMVLKMACYKAIAEGIIPTNPVNSTKLPAYHKKEHSC